MPCAATANSVKCDGGIISVVSNAIRAFKNSVTVTAVSVPNCERGATDCLLGNVVITETQNGQLKAGQIDLRLDPPALDHAAE